MSNNLPTTENLYSKSIPIDHLKINDAITLMIDEQQDATKKIKEALFSIKCAINEIYKHLKINTGGRLIYVGAGTSGRIGVQDGVELVPTFDWPKNRLDFIIAGGSQALVNSVENAEDDLSLALEMINQKKINSKDVVIGLAASGNTPFTCKVMKEASEKNALTISISNNIKGNILKYGKVKIILDTREEVIAGSTRLKAGTAQKICLNIISSMVMVKMGRVKNGMMNNLLPTNNKLRKRKKIIDSELCMTKY